MRTPLFLLLLFPIGLSADDIPTSSAVTEVTVFADRARVSRVAEVAIPAGDHVVAVSGLPVGLEDASLQATATADGPLTLRGAEVRSVFAAEPESPRFVTLKAELEAVNEAITSLEAQVRDNGDRREFLNAIRTALSGGGGDNRSAPLATGADDIAELFTFYSGGLTELTEREHELRLELEEMQPIKQALEEELERLKATGRTTTKQARISFSASEPRTATVRISYTIGGASWRPLYRARADREVGEVQLEMQGEVRQATGEDWNNARLTLSTARPSEGAVMPELPPEWLRLMEPLPVSAARQAPAESFTMDASEMKAKAMPVDEVGDGQDALPDYATLESTGLNLAYRIPGTKSVPSDNEPHLVPVSAVALEAGFDYGATPILSEAAYLRARVTNSSDAVILPGEAMIFRDGDFVGTTQLALTAPGEEFDFWLGIDDNIRISTDLLVDKAGDTGLIRKRESLTRKRQFEIENFRDEKSVIEVFARVPVSQNEKITVDDPRFSRKPEEFDSKTGEIKWQLELEPKGKETWTLEYTVGWPQGEAVIGL